MSNEIVYVHGDATRPQGEGPKVIAHVCNDTGGWGRGFVVALSRRWPQPEAAYRRWYKERSGNDFALGAIQLVQAEPGLWVANMIGQHGIRTRGSDHVPIRYEAIDQALQHLADAALRLGASVHMPRIGAGLAGGRWEQIEPLIQTRLTSKGLAVTVYDL
ncbi:macro domain-containing protein [Streptomyces griseocarneus]|uniref:macro domain-containing protein n=1 Tax=Streptomyces griseocarneus TaxID=51201 RepID=UPI00167EE103|nr:macro domain-containing protein [Streptomyces griseocarneus]MBZ6476447.1 macro domain-containing protein [Streptomyces griseocarneus]